MNAIKIVSAVAFFITASALTPFVTTTQPQEEEPGPDDFVADELLVKFKPDVLEERKQQIHKRHGSREKDYLYEIGVYVLTLPRGKSPKGAAREYNLEEDVEFAEPNGFLHPAFVPNDPEFIRAQWNLTRIGVNSAWDVTKGSPSVKIAIVDTGVGWLDHPDLKSKIVGGCDWTTVNPNIPCVAPIDYGPTDQYYHGHGAHVAGTASAATNNGTGIAGVGFNSSLLIEKVCYWQTGYGSLWNYFYGIRYPYDCPYDYVAKGINGAVSHGANVINISLSGNFDSQTVRSAVYNAWNKGAVLTCPAGNEGINIDFAKRYPASYDVCIAVAATNQWDYLAKFSYGGSNWGWQVDVSAPGVQIFSTVDYSYKYYDGTSFAAPHVAGIAALVRAKCPFASNTIIRRNVERGVVDLGNPGRDEIFGWGRVDAAKAVAQPCT